MIIYKDRITGDELFSDIYPMKEVDDILIEVTGKMTTESKGADFDIGANPSAGGGDGDEGADDLDSESGVDVVLANRLMETGFDMKSYKVHIKDYMKAVKVKLQEEDPDRVGAFTAGAQKFVGALIKDKERFKDLQFFTGESQNPDWSTMP
eukprot:UN25645